MKSENNRKLIKIGRNSKGVILPAKLLKDLNWHEKQKLLVKRMPRGILIRDALTKHKK